MLPPHVIVRPYQAAILYVVTYLAVLEFQFEAKIKRGTLMMENLTQPETRTGRKRLKLVGI